MSGEFIAKISNFGFARISDKNYFAKTTVSFNLALEHLPQNNAFNTAQIAKTPEIAPEADRHQIFSEKSDIFSFGILLAVWFDLSIVDYAAIVEVANSIANTKGNIKPMNLEKPFYADRAT